MAGPDLLADVRPLFARLERAANDTQSALSSSGITDALAATDSTPDPLAVLSEPLEPLDRARLYTMLAYGIASTASG